MKDAEKRAFATQVLQFMEENGETMTAAGFDTTTYKTNLTAAITKAVSDEDQQAQAFASYKDASATSLNSTAEAYKLGSSVVEIANAVLGKEHTLVQELRKLR